MIPFSFERSQVLPITLEQAWDFFSNPLNLAKITPPEMKFRVTSLPVETTYAGQIITYTVRPLMGVTVNWTTEITHVDAPRFFVDEQRFGPYRFWHHQHRFREVAGGVEVGDQVHYLFHQDYFARLINRVLVAPRLKKIFDYRSNVLKELFEK